MESDDRATPFYHHLFLGCWPHKVFPRWLLWSAEEGVSEDRGQVVQYSAIVNETQLVGSQSGEPIVPIRDWASFLEPQFKRLTGIKRYHHFRFDRCSPGVVYLKLHSGSDEERRRLVKDQFWRPEASDLPPQILPSGFSQERKHYLFEKVTAERRQRAWYV